MSTDPPRLSHPRPPRFQVVEWVKPPVMGIPTLFYKDLKAAGLKNDSTMAEYNIYATGSGGPCKHWANDGDEWAYVCSNSTAGGWEEIERGLVRSSGDATERARVSHLLLRDYALRPLFFVTGLHWPAGLPCRPLLQPDAAAVLRPLDHAAD